MACPVKTFVFFDLEATGLSQDLPKVTEICLVAVHISSLENPVTDEAGNVQLPRVLDKLCLCVDPRKTIMEKASSITGLSNKNLDDCEKRPFDLNIIQLIKEFVNRQSQPVCLVAHNGIFYDFPLLKAEFQQQRDDLPTHVLCLDSLKAFRTLDRQDGLNENGRGPHTLSAIYRRYFNKEPVDSHYAEGDVLTLVLVFMSKACKLLELANTQFIKWGDVKPMYVVPFLDSD